MAKKLCKAFNSQQCYSFDTYMNHVALVYVNLRLICDTKMRDIECSLTFPLWVLKEK